MICSVSLVFIMFYGGFGTNIKEAKPVIARSVVLSTAGVVLTAGLTGLFIHFVLGLSLLESLLTASVIGSTDAASVFGILRSKNLNLKEHTASLLEMESGSNDPISYMLTVILTGLLTGASIRVPAMLFQQLFGLIFGVLFGKGAVWALNRLQFQIAEGKTIFVFAAAVLAYAVPVLLGGNGYLSVYLCGIIMGNSSVPHKRNMVQFFDALTGIAQMMIFFLLGLLVTPSRLGVVLLFGSDHGISDISRTSSGCDSASGRFLKHPGSDRNCFRPGFGGIHCICHLRCAARSTDEIRPV